MISLLKSTVLIGLWLKPIKYVEFTFPLSEDSGYGAMIVNFLILNNPDLLINENPLLKKIFTNK